MTSDPSTPANLVNVRGTELLASDTREQYRQKLARITLDSMVQFVGLLDAEGRVLEINHVALDAVGVDLSEVEGKHFWHTFWWRVSPEINATLKDSIRRAAQGEFVRWDAEIYGRAGGKETIIIDASLMPVMDTQGKVVFITAEGRDITEKKAHEREIARQREELAKLDELKTQFFANISHEFRTPLTLMLGPIEDVLNDQAEPLTPSQRDRLEMVQRNGLRLQKLVNTLLDFSRVEAGRIQAVYQPTDLAAFTRDLVSNFRSACEKAGLTLDIDATPLPEPVYIDREMWEKIVLNLVSNAFKFTFKGGIKVTLTKEGNNAVLRVSDSGTGIPPEEVPLIFERFHRVEGAQGRTHEGSGIGLALVQELAHLHKGSVSAMSEFGRGTIFTVSVPFGSAHLPQARIDGKREQASTATRADAFVSEALRWLPDEQAAQTPPDSDEQGALQDIPVSGIRANILVADDNADMRDYVKRLLLARHDVTTVADGAEALAAIERTHPDLVLTDIMMPHLDGFGLLRRIRENPELRDIQVILLSARAGEDAKAEGLQKGADDYLVKPFSARELLTHVEANLNMSRLRRETTDALRFRTTQFQTLLNQAPIGVYLVDWDLRIREVNPTAQALLSQVAGGVDGKTLVEVMRNGLDEKTADDIVDIFRHTLATGEPFIESQSADGRDARGHVQNLEWRVDRILLPDGKFGAVCYFRDISERVQAENTRQLLLNELNHRVKNTLANVQAIARQTLQHTKDPADFAARFSGRIQSLARIHSMLTDAKWQGADLRKLVLDQLLQGPVDESRVSVVGPTVNLGHQTALALALMLHEMGTNSIKYGALSTPKGKISINWWLRNNTLHLSWVERGGPAVTAPTRRGFGTTLIEQSVKSEQGSAEILYETEGVTWNISLALPQTMSNSPASELLRPEQTSAAIERAEENDKMKSESLFAGLRLLVIEDDPLIALDMAQRLEMAGARQVASTGSEEEALQMIEATDFDATLLDANLHGHPVDTIAAALTRRNIPFVFVTGYGRDGLPDSFKQAPLLTKPFNDQQLIEVMTGLVKRQGNVVQLKP